MISWVKWFFWDRVRCRHAKSYFTLESVGRDKVEWCKGCNRALGVNGKSLVFWRK